ncbi:hypothetical protein MSPP1_000058 [Malassezia sp. CBS 17886]|nr:hypothetical protein MSPP1_000058 [Malassezia sp. CBS 17886]
MDLSSPSAETHPDVPSVLEPGKSPADVSSSTAESPLTTRPGSLASSWVSHASGLAPALSVRQPSLGAPAAAPSAAPDDQFATESALPYSSPRTPGATARNNRHNFTSPSDAGVHEYDRAGQVGLGELATPRWLLSGGDQSHSALYSPDASPNRPFLGTQPPVSPSDHSLSTAAPPVPSWNDTAARHARAISYSVGGPNRTRAEPRASLPSFASVQQLASATQQGQDAGSTSVAQIPEPAEPIASPSASAGRESIGDASAAGDSMGPCMSRSSTEGSIAMTPLPGVSSTPMISDGRRFHGLAAAANLRGDAAPQSAAPQKLRGDRDATAPPRVPPADQSKRRSQRLSSSTFVQSLLRGNAHVDSRNVSRSRFLSLGTSNDVLRKVDGLPQSPRRADMAQAQHSDASISAPMHTGEGKATVDAPAQTPRSPVAHTSQTLLHRSPNPRVQPAPTEFGDPSALPSLPHQPDRVRRTEPSPRDGPPQDTSTLDAFSSTKVPAVVAYNVPGYDASRKSSAGTDGHSSFNELKDTRDGFSMVSGESFGYVSMRPSEPGHVSAGTSVTAGDSLQPAGSAVSHAPTSPADARAPAVDMAHTACVDVRRVSAQPVPGSADTSVDTSLGNTTNRELPMHKLRLPPEPTSPPPPRSLWTPRSPGKVRQRMSLQTGSSDAPARDAEQDADESGGSLAGRLSRRSLLALSSLFKSPRRSVMGDRGDADTQQAASIESGADAVAEKPKSRSRLSFTRKRRQSVPVAAPDSSTQEPSGASAAASPRKSGISVARKTSMRTAPAAASSPAHAAGAMSTQQESEPDVAPNISPYHTAKAQGSKIPRASSMMRILTRRSTHEEALPTPRAPQGRPAATPTSRQTPSRLPQSTSMHSVRYTDVPVQDSTSLPRTTSLSHALASHLSLTSDAKQASGPPDAAPPAAAAPPKPRLLATQRMRPSPTKRSVMHDRKSTPAAATDAPGEDAKPMKVRTLRRSQASTEAADALRRQRNLQTGSEEKTIGRRAPAAAAVRPPRTEYAGAPAALPLVWNTQGSSGATRTNSTASATPPQTSQTSSGVSMAAAIAAQRLDDERSGDQEMENHIQRVQQRKRAGGARQEELDRQLEFPQPVVPSKRLMPRQAEIIYGNHLCPYELKELYDYESIYYVGSFARHKHYAVHEKPERNFGYDDERGDYEINARDHLAFRYEIIKLLGRGSFGQVLQCKDHKTGKFVAVKLIRNKRRFHHQALVEVKIMEHLTKADPHVKQHVVHMTDSFVFRSHLCVTMELLSINLYELIKANSFEGFSTQLIRRFTQQTVRCLALMRELGIVHCDLKPENILLTHPRRSEIKVIDFGSSCFENEKVYTYIQSRFYRSPEVILGMDYNMAIDMWSLGCILSELHTGYPIFPGENEQDQLACMMEVLGAPDKHLLEHSTRRKLFFDSTGQSRPVVSSRGHRRRPNSKTLADAVHTDDPYFLDFIARCLTWDPERRISADAALRHPWFTQAPDRAATSRTPGTAARAVRSSTSSVRRSTKLTTGGLSPSEGGEQRSAQASTSASSMLPRASFAPAANSATVRT